MWPLIALFILTTVAGELLRPKPKFDTPRASSLGDFTLPTAEEGRPVPVVFGTCRIRGANVVWYGNLQVVAITEKVKTGMFSSTTVTKGYKYYMDLQAALCHGQVDAIVKFRFDDKDAAQSQSSITGGVQVSVNDTGLFGGDEKEGGVSGDIEVYTGSTTQPASSYLATAVGNPVPGYRGICHAVFKSFYFGTSNYIKTFSVDVRRCPNTLGLSAGKHNINGDANPACMLYEILTDTLWGLGISTAQIDATSFTTAGTTLYSEALGLSMLLDSQKDASGWIEEIMRHIDGVLYPDPATGLFTLALIRGGYSIGSLPVYNTSNILSCEYSRGSWAQTINTVKVTYIDRAQEYTERTVQAQDMANIQARLGEIATETIAFSGFGTADAANAAAYRSMKALSYPLAKMMIEANRSAWSLRPGSVFRLDWAPLGIQGMACRVGRIEYGNLTDGKIRIEAVEDIWGTISTVYSAPGSTDWIDPVASLDPLAYQRIEEVPWHLQLDDQIRVMCLGVRQHATVNGYTVWSDKTGGTNYVQTATINAVNASVTLRDDMLVSDPVYLAGGITVYAGQDSEHIASCTSDQFTDGANLLRIGNEYVAFQNVVDNGDGTLTLSPIWRGVLDTIPATHVAGTLCVHLQGIGLMQDGPLPAPSNVTAKFLTFNGRDAYPIGSATQLTLTTNNRAASPYPPGNVTVNSLNSPSKIYGDAVMNWNHRNRPAQLKLARQDAGDVSGGPEGTYTVKVYVNGVLKQSTVGTTAKTYTYTAAQRAADNSNCSLTTRLEITPENGAYSGTVRQIDLVMTGFGMPFGMYFGGIQG